MMSSDYLSSSFPCCSAPSQTASWEANHSISSRCQNEVREPGSLLPLCQWRKRNSHGREPKIEAVKIGQWTALPSRRNPLFWAFPITFHSSAKNTAYKAGTATARINATAFRLTFLQNISACYTRVVNTDSELRSHLVQITEKKNLFQMNCTCLCVFKFGLKRDSWRQARPMQSWYNCL